MPTRSKFLVHWSGRDIAAGNEAALDEPSRFAYVERLVSILDQGFWVNEPYPYPEEVTGYGGRIFTHTAAMTCFTEIKLSQVATHAVRYGRLGIGVTREWVLDRTGGPVHYVRNRQTECIVGTFGHLHEFLLNPKIQEQLAEDEHPVELLETLITFLKPMSQLEDEDEEEYEFLEEQEWRIVWNTAIDPDLAFETGEDRPKLLLPLARNDVKLLVFPDDATKALALDDSRFVAWKDRSRRWPIMVTLDDCNSF